MPKRISVAAPKRARPDALSVKDKLPRNHLAARARERAAEMLELDPESLDWSNALRAVELAIAPATPLMVLSGRIEAEVVKSATLALVQTELPRGRGLQSAEDARSVAELWPSGHPVDGTALSAKPDLQSEHNRPLGDRLTQSAIAALRATIFAQPRAKRISRRGRGLARAALAAIEPVAENAAELFQRVLEAGDPRRARLGSQLAKVWLQLLRTGERAPDQAFLSLLYTEIYPLDFAESRSNSRSRRGGGSSGSSSPADGGGRPCSSEGEATRESRLSRARRQLESFELSLDPSNAAAQGAILALETLPERAVLDGIAELFRCPPWSIHGIGPQTVEEVADGVARFPTYVAARIPVTSAADILGVVFTAHSASANLPSADDLATGIWAPSDPTLCLYHAITVRRDRVAGSGLSQRLLEAAVRAGSTIPRHVTVTPGFDWISLAQKLVLACPGDGPLWTGLHRFVHTHAPAAAADLSSGTLLRRWAEILPLLSLTELRVDPSASALIEVFAAAIVTSVWTTKGGRSALAFAPADFHGRLGAVLRAVRVASSTRNAEAAGLGLRFHFEYGAGRAVAADAYADALASLEGEDAPYFFRTVAIDPRGVAVTKGDEGQ